MDGNGRWAKKNHFAKKKGHEAGVTNCIKICNNLSKLDCQIKELSFYVFSTENWKRNPSEINNLFNLIEIFYKNFQKVANDNNLIIRHCGSRKKISKKLLNIIDEVTEKTKSNTGTFVNLMFNYGSRQEIQDAMIKMQDAKNHKKKLNDFFYITESNDPDLIIRTGGEKRLSNFMLWQGAYSELYFTNTLWPDFKYSNFNRAIQNYFKRNRKYGK